MYGSNGSGTATMVGCMKVNSWRALQLVALSATRRSKGAASRTLIIDQQLLVGSAIDVGLGVDILAVGEVESLYRVAGW